jgi:acyl-CoA synthetase (AMP-forming)/AMP-acid ligase II
MTFVNSFIDDLASTVHECPDKIALLDARGRQVSYGELFKLINAAHAFLASRGLKPRDALVALLPNSIEAIVVFLACMRGGFSYAPMPCTSTIEEIVRLKNHTRAKLCIVASPVSTSVQNRLFDINDWDTMTLDFESYNCFGEASISPADECGRLLIPTSGSTGEPKAIVLDGDRLWSAGKAFLQFHSIESTNIRFWNYLPMSYLGGLFNLTLIPLAAGGSIYIDEPFNGKTFLTFWATVERFHINALWLVPTILRGLNLMAGRVKNLMQPQTMVRFCFLGTAPVSVAEKEEFFSHFGIEALENYGLSETTFISSDLAGSIGIRKNGDVGLVMPNINIKLSQIDSALEIDGLVQNEILVRSPYAMLGYLDKQGHINLPIDGEGFLNSGDYGYVSEGRLFITGRGRDIIKKGGILIALREIEIAAEGFDGVLEAAAVKIDHPFYGESHELFLIPKDQPINEKEFLAAFSARLHSVLSGHKWPDKIFLCSDFPRTASGKVQKHLIKSNQIQHENS